MMRLYQIWYEIRLSLIEAKRRDLWPKSVSSLPRCQAANGRSTTWDAHVVRPEAFIYSGHRLHLPSLKDV